jgi:hypothetical protein
MNLQKLEPTYIHHDVARVAKAVTTKERPMPAIHQSRKSDQTKYQMTEGEMSAGGRAALGGCHHLNMHPLASPPSPPLRLLPFMCMQVACWRPTTGSNAQTTLPQQLHLQRP